MSHFLHHHSDNVKAIAIPQVFSENSGAKNIPRLQSEDLLYDLLKTSLIPSSLVL